MDRREALGHLVAGLSLTSLLKPELAAAQQRPGRVETVRGPIDLARLGFTLSHEHVAASSAGMWQAWPEFFGGRAQFIKIASDQLKQAKDEGVDTIIDVTTVDLGRDIRLLEEISRRSGMQIVACTGHWIDPSRSMLARTADELAEFFVREIQRGIEGTDIKAGIIKVGTGNMLDAFGEKALRAAARASKATGVPITTHSPGTERMGLKHAEIFEGEGLMPAKACIGHTDNSPADYQLALVRRGYYLGMDQVPRGGPPAGTPQSTALTWDQRYMQIKALVDAGFAERIMIGNDHSIGMSLQPTAGEKARLEQNPDGMLFLTRKTLPALRKIGIPDQAIRTMMVDCPRRFFS
jgi:phosphotriesterase-related protein